MGLIPVTACCACGETKPDVRNIVMVPKKAPIPGRGWGCFQCGLPNDGAIAVVCDACIRGNVPLKFAVKGYVVAGERVPIESLTGTHDHNMRRHPEHAVWN